ncbi:MAG: ester cyclase [Alphaproteobacteria bacterium]|nr:ester cyclase [Alphaproteobacteria bacterium]
MKPVLGRYANVHDFIYGITREIWEDRGIGGKIGTYYAGKCLVRAATGVTTSNDGVTAQTLQTLHQFPDRQLVGEDVIWNDEGDGSFLSSHRLISVMRHQGDGSYGTATNRMVRTRIIADCWVKDAIVTEEWLVRDQAAFAHCLGLAPVELARRMVAHEIALNGRVDYFTPERDVAGVYRAPMEDAPDVRRYREGWLRIWGVKETAAIRDLYFHGAAVSVPGGGEVNGHGDIDRFCLGYLASFPDGVFTCESAFANREPGRATRLTMRWGLRGTHAGFGRFGAPTGAPVYVMGMNHAHMVDGRVTQEWIVTDEVSIWKQILAHQEGRAGA